MFKIIAIIIVSVSIFGIVVFAIVRNFIKKRINFYLKEKKNKLSKF
tara:strand:+ start:306 stop:443 length:138 start_codon:yes stop_codon:yes gene_type:complete